MAGRDGRSQHQVQQRPAGGGQHGQRGAGRQRQVPQHLPADLAFGGAGKGGAASSRLTRGMAFWNTATEAV